MKDTSLRFVGVELYFDDLERAKKCYAETLGLRVAEEQVGRYVKFEGGTDFICLERKGSEAYPSSDKAALFFEVPDLQAAIAAVGATRLVRSESQWAVMHDPEGHNVLLLQTGAS
jgi:predicted enzyme related to lactoylglutathione lyase